MKSFVLAGREVGPDCPPLVIPEIGINHNGDLEIAKQMALAAKEAGAELIKHQTHIPEEEMSDAAKKVIPGNTDKSIYDVISSCSLNEEQEFEFKEYVESIGLIYLSTPFSLAAVERLDRMGVHGYKIGSGECNNIPLLELVGSKGKPVILSTGMNTLESVKKSVATLQKFDVPIAILHTTNLYPTPAHLVRLGAMMEMHNEFPELPFGLSDHTVSNLACLSAVALGAVVLERHFTDSMDREGPDIVCSMDPAALTELITQSKEVMSMRGGKKEPAAEEQVTIDFAFATLVAVQDINPGEELSSNNVVPKRPAVGEIPAEEFSEVAGKKASSFIPKGEHIKREQVDW